MAGISSYSFSHTPSKKAGLCQEMPDWVKQILWLWSGQRSLTEIQIPKLLILHGIILYQLKDFEFVFLEAQ